MCPCTVSRVSGSHLEEFFLIRLWLLRDLLLDSFPSSPLVYGSREAAVKSRIVSLKTSTWNLSFCTNLSVSHNVHRLINSTCKVLYLSVFALLRWSRLFFLLHCFQSERSLMVYLFPDRLLDCFPSSVFLVLLPLFSRFCVSEIVFSSSLILHSCYKSQMKNLQCRC